MKIDSDKTVEEVCVQAEVGEELLGGMSTSICQAPLLLLPSVNKAESTGEGKRLWEVKQ